MLLKKKKMLDILAIKKMKQVDLAAALGVSRGHMNNVLKGRRKLSLKHSKWLIELFGAELMSKIIDWDAMGMNDPFGEPR